MKVALLGAMSIEVDGLKMLLSDTTDVTLDSWEATQGRAFGHEILLGGVGVGKVEAASAAQAYNLGFKPEAVIFTGIGGILDPSLQIGDVVVATECVQHDMDATALGYERGIAPFTKVGSAICDRRLIDLAMSFPVSDHQMVKGRILTGDTFIAGNRAENPHLNQMVGMMVEMEGAAVGSVCVRSKVPYVVIRTGSDFADDSSHLSYREFIAQKGDLVTSRSKGIVRHMLQNLPAQW